MVEKHSNIIAVLASDGLFDDVSNTQLGKMVVQELLSAENIVQRVVTRGKSQDNITVIVVHAAHTK
jgi:serine/threonine protein phosphatase PrpC